MTASTATRTCAICREPKPLTEFHHNAAQPLGYGYQCRDCANAERRKRYAVNPRKYIAITQSWYASNGERAKALGDAAKQRYRTKLAAERAPLSVENMAEATRAFAEDSRRRSA